MRVLGNVFVIDPTLLLLVQQPTVVLLMKGTFSHSILAVSCVNAETVGFKNLIKIYF